MRVTPAGVIGSLALFVAMSGTAVAANGDAVLLGKSNSATKPTSISNSNGTALKLTSKAGTPPLSVGTNGTQVPSLNASKVGGLSASQLQRRITGACRASGIAAVAGSGQAACATGLIAFTTPGMHEFTVPAGVTQAIVTLRGGGGGGGGAESGGGGGGGGQGGLVSAWIVLTPAATYAVGVGVGGAGGTTGVGDWGGASSIALAADFQNAFVLAEGGSPGSGAGPCGDPPVSGGGGGDGSASGDAVGIDVRVGDDGQPGGWYVLSDCGAQTTHGLGGAPGGSGGFFGTGGTGGSDGAGSSGEAGFVSVAFVG